MHHFGVSFVACWIGLTLGTCWAEIPALVPQAAQGIMVGEVTAQSANVQVRVTTQPGMVRGDVKGGPGRVEFVLSRQHDGAVVARREQAANAAHDYIARASFLKLSPGVRYVCSTKIMPDEGKVTDGPTAKFSTLGGATQAANVSFVVVTGMNYAKFHGDQRIDRAIHKVQNNTELPSPYAGKDKSLGYPALEAIWRLRPSFFVGTGDNVYYDTPKKPRAQSIGELRQKWHEQFVQPRYRQLFADVPTYWMMDDHDYRIDDCDNSGDYAPSPSLGKRVFLEQLPIGAQADLNVRTFRTYRVSKDLQVWFPENRLFRSDNRMKDGPGKSIWGAPQATWLKQTLKESDATFKLLISPTPMVGPDDKRKTDNHTNLNGFRFERDEFFSWLQSSGVGKRNFYVVCGDRHWQYHAQHPSGVEEFSCGALVDANSRLGRKPGDPDSTDPEATITQLYSQSVRSGGFLEVRLLHRPAPSLTFVWHDEHGAILHEHTKTVAAASR